MKANEERADMYTCKVLCGSDCICLRVIKIIADAAAS